MDGFICIGRLGKAHGVRGTLSVIPMTDFPERFRTTGTVYVAHDGADPVPYPVTRAREAAGRILLDLEGVTGRDAARSLTNAYVYVRSDQVVPLGEGEYYFHQLNGCRVLDDATGEEIGRITGGEQLASNDVLQVALAGGGTVFIPMIGDVIAAVDIAAGTVRIHVLKGLL